MNAPEKTFVQWLREKARSTDDIGDATDFAKAADVIDKLYQALEGILPPMPPKDALCHVGICPQERCGNCSRIATGYAALRKARAAA